MPTLRSGESASIRLEPGDTVRVEASSASSAVIFDPLTFDPAVTASAVAKTVGPYSDARNLKVLCTSGAVSYTVGLPGFNQSSLSSSKGCVQTLKAFGAPGVSVGAAFTFTNSFMVEGDYNAVRFSYENRGGTAYTISAAKTAASPSLTDSGTGLTHTNVTYDNAATAKAGDVWNGASGATTTFDVPARISGSGADCVPSIVWSDWIPQQSVPCTEPGASDLRVIQHRVYSASTGYLVANSGSGPNNWGDYNANSRRKVFGALTAGNQVGTITAVTPASGHTWMMCTGVQALLTKPIYNHGVFGDSISKGQGSFDNANGGWGWSQRATQQLTDQGIGRHSVVNYAVSGQGKAATWNTFLNVISQGGLDTATMFPWSPNDGATAGAAPWALNNFRFQVYAFIAECKKYGTKPIIATQPPSVTITDSASDLIRIAINNEIRELKLQGVSVSDFDAVLSNGAAPARYGSGMSNGDNQHPSAAGHAAMSIEYARAAREALGI